MAAKKGHQKVGGRGVGTPNKTTSTVREWLSKLIDDNRNQFEDDFKQLEAKDRVLIMEKLLSYVAPKMQALDAKIEEQKPMTSQIVLTYVKGEIPIFNSEEEIIM